MPVHSGAAFAAATVRSRVLCVPEPRFHLRSVAGYSSERKRSSVTVLSPTDAERGFTQCCRERPPAGVREKAITPAELESRNTLVKDNSNLLAKLGIISPVHNGSAAARPYAQVSPSNIHLCCCLSGALRTYGGVGMSDPHSKLERLEAAGILEPRQFSEEELALVGTITDEEIDVLIRLRERLGKPESEKGHIKPNIIV